MSITSLPRPLVVLGLAGILPQAFCLVMALSGGEARWTALAAACCYAALILSFLGGLWWMAGLLGGVTAPWFHALAVLPSLIGWAMLLPWCVGAPWPAPELVTLGLLLLASPLADRALARHMAQNLALPAGWQPLRVIMATGLGTLTILVGLLA
ncbi:MULTISPECIES: DUF3429 family protein [unclassified Novosphingobium]|uniref:DUF3429 family protein n=1 Tax=unclassified Novosphingobium TaxID=2644732 RepID=UPI00146A0C16|nr:MULTISPECIES: DUF3429 family protein [unclassified Novosphingobium]NMN04944.1 hypothetical protein [Novosphingobium sp. SG919]NMN87237.1 hypothetical protein [Novosphingobium sp. SG916]